MITFIKSFFQVFDGKYQILILNVSNQCNCIDKFSSKDKLNCFVQCNINPDCALFTRIENECRLYSEEALHYLIKATQPCLYVKQTTE